MLKWNEPKKNYIHKSYAQENTGDGILFSVVADMWGYSFSKRDSITDAFPWKLWRFTNITFTEHCCVTVSDFL